MKRKRHTPRRDHQEAARSGDAAGGRPRRGGNLQEAGSQPADLPPMAAGIWRGQGGDRQAAQMAADLRLCSAGSWWPWKSSGGETPKTSSVFFDQAVAARGRVPEFIRSDNGPEFVALAVPDWIRRRGFATLYIKPGSSWQNASSGSFNSRFRDEFLNRELCSGLMEAKVLGKEHRPSTTTSACIRRWTTKRRWSSRSAALRLHTFP